MHRSIFARAFRAGAIVLALAVVSGSALAQQPSTANVGLAREIVEASGATRAFDNVVPSILQQSLSIFVQQNPDLQKDLTASIQALSPEFEKRKSNIIDIVATVYSTRFTEPELKEILAFYRSNTGKKFVAQLPGVLEESFVKTQEWGAKLSEEIVVRLRAEMKKKGHTI